MALADTARLLVELRLDDKMSGPLGRATGSLNRVQSGLFQTGRGIGQVAAGLGRVGVIAAGAAATGLATVAHLAGNFEAQLNTINTIAQTNSEALSNIGEGIRNTFRETGQPLDDLTSGYYDLLSAGVKVADAQKELDLAVRLGIGGLGSTAEAVDLLTTAQNSYALTADQTTKAADVFAKAVEDGKVKISEISATFANVAPTAHQFGVSINEIGAAYAFLTAKGVPAAEVSTQMNRAILDLVKPSKDAKAVLDDLGTTGEDLIAKDGLVGALQALRDRADEMGVPFQKLFGRIEGYKFALQTTGDAQAGFNAELKRMGDSAGEVNTQFEERAKGLNYQLGRLKALAQDAGITIGDALLPKLVPLVERLNDFITKHQADIAKFGQELADGIGKFADSISEADIGNFVNGLKTIASVGAQVAKIFLSLPAGIQAIILGGAAINRLSGGLVGAGVGNIIGGGIKLLFERGASPANPLWVATVNGGLPGGGIPGLPAVGGLGAGAASIATAAILAPTAIALFRQMSGDPNVVGSRLGFKPGDPLPVKVVASSTPLGQFNSANMGGVRGPQGFTPTGQFSPLNRGGTVVGPGGVSVHVTNFETLEQKLTNNPNFKASINSAAEFIRLLKRTSEFGAKGVGTSIEHGPKTGRDPVGDAFLALTNRLTKPALRSVEVQGEISRHIKALEQVQGRLLREGNIAEARHAQRNIDKMERLIGEVDKTIPHFRAIEQKVREQTQKANEAKIATERGLATANRSLGVIERKNFSPSFNASIYTTVNAQLSTYTALQTINRVDNIRFNGKPVPTSAA